VSRQTRRRLLQGTGAALAAGLAGCSENTDGGDDDAGGDTATGGIGGGSSTEQAYTVGHDDYETEVTANAFPDMLYFYCVQSGWMNWPSIMESFESNYGVAVNDNDRSSGEALQHMRANAANMNHSGYNGGYTYGVRARNEGFTQAYKPAGWEQVPDSLKTDE